VDTTGQGSLGVKQEGWFDGSTDCHKVVKEMLQEEYTYA